MRYRERADCIMDQSVTFTDDEIGLARQMRDQGLLWEPAVGHYVFDDMGLIDAPSPFQPRVYFILDLKHFLRRSSDIETLKSRMLWPPQWHEARRILRGLGVSDAMVMARLVAARAIETQSELCLLYELILETLSARAGAVDA